MAKKKKAVKKKKVPLDGPSDESKENDWYRKRMYVRGKTIGLYGALSETYGVERIRLLHAGALLVKEKLRCDPTFKSKMAKYDI